MPPLLARDFSFELPAELIAQNPSRRGHSRLLVVPKDFEKPLRHRGIRDLPGFLEPGDCLVVNDSKVIPARLHGIKTGTGAQMEMLLHRELLPAQWEALVRPYRRVAVGTEIQVGGRSVRVAELLGAGRVLLDFGTPRAAKWIIQHCGEPPLPPYIRREAAHDWKTDRRRYQTVFASEPGSVAAPTAGLHFSPGLLRSLAKGGVRVLPVTLHVGWGTFLPLPEGDLAGAALHSERYSVSLETAAALAGARRLRKRIIAVGTTAARTLESAADANGEVRAGSGETKIFIQPGYVWKALDGLLTNFHLPESSLLMLVCAWGGTARVLAAYREAVQQKYHFYSYGDAMLLL